ncbi:hypothetical protein ACFSBZ_11525 [Amnibacterium flavum]|uniref:Integral membrane protein n=1 Tax=Amnibacterium flavum TaxID=2173173 RepID=A0A2V1HUR6_9MICO|nr:hypothetical protein [Amnibacterium flavum]PVZ95442.1 hypothetical protein DDQ50_02740 [Amnibacterium flavum]
MRHLVRIWTAMAAFGAALIHLAVAASAPMPLLIAFAVAGLAEIAWAVATLIRGCFTLPRVVPVLALIPSAIWAIGVSAGNSSSTLPFLALGAGTALGVFVAVTVALENRRGLARAETTEPGAGRNLLGFVAGAFLMAAVALPALGQTQAGIAASEGPHAHHSVDLNIDLDHGGH